MNHYFVVEGVDYGWRLVSPNNSLSYICEISQQDAYTILTQKRDFSKLQFEDPFYLLPNLIFIEDYKNQEWSSNNNQNFLWNLI